MGVVEEPGGDLCAIRLLALRLLVRLNLFGEDVGMTGVPGIDPVSRPAYR
ncbi:hypothetical protein [Nocardia sp. NPDC004711]